MTFKKGGNNKTAVVVLRCTPEEKASAKTRAAEAGLSLSSFLLARALGRPVHSTADQQMINDLRKIGGLMKHIHNETKGAYSRQTAEALHEITGAIKRIGDT